MLSWRSKSVPPTMHARRPREYRRTGPKDRLRSGDSRSTEKSDVPPRCQRRARAPRCSGSARNCRAAAHRLELELDMAKTFRPCGSGELVLRRPVGLRVMVRRRRPDAQHHVLRHAAILCPPAGSARGVTPGNRPMSPSNVMRSRPTCPSSLFIRLVPRMDLRRAHEAAFGTVHIFMQSAERPKWTAGPFPRG